MNFRPRMCAVECYWSILLYCEYVPMVYSIWKLHLEYDNFEEIIQRFWNKTPRPAVVFLVFEP